MKIKNTESISDQPKPWLAVISAIVIAVILLVILFSGVYNSLNDSKNDCEAQWSQVENVMQRRADLIPNLVATVKGQMANEQKIFSEIAESRKTFDSASSPNEKLAADQELGNATTVLLNAVKENYPDLASSDSVKTLMTQLEGSENRISVERKRYIDDVNEYDKKIGSFPMNLIAKSFGFEKIDQYQADKSAETVPMVDFD